MSEQGSPGSPEHQNPREETLGSLKVYQNRIPTPGETLGSQMLNLEARPPSGEAPSSERLGHLDRVLARHHSNLVKIDRDGSTAESQQGLQRAELLLAMTQAAEGIAQQAERAGVAPEEVGYLSGDVENAAMAEVFPATLKQQLGETKGPLASAIEIMASPNQGADDQERHDRVAVATNYYEAVKLLATMMSANESRETIGDQFLEVKEWAAKLQEGHAGAEQLDQELGASGEDGVTDDDPDKTRVLPAVEHGDGGEFVTGVLPVVESRGETGAMPPVERHGGFEWLDGDTELMEGLGARVLRAVQAKVPWLGTGPGSSKPENQPSSPKTSNLDVLGVMMGQSETPVESVTGGGEGVVGEGSEQQKPVDLTPVEAAVAPGEQEENSPEAKTESVDWATKYKKDIEELQADLAEILAGVNLDESQLPEKDALDVADIREDIGRTQKLLGTLGSDVNQLGPEAMTTAT